jgi:cytochrome P450
VPHSESLGGYYLLLRYGDVRDALADWRTFSSSPRVFRPLTGRASTPPIDFDPPGHKPWRALFNQAFNPRTARAAEEQTRAGAETLIDVFAGAGTCDLIDQYADALPVIALCGIIGFPVHKHADVRRLTVELFEAAPYPARAREAFRAFSEFALAEARTRRDVPQDDFITHLVQAEIDGRPLTDDEIGTAMVVLLGAGHETTVSALGSLLFEVLSKPSLAQGVASDRALLDHAIDEALRLHPPLFGPFRRMRAPAQLSGRQLPWDSSVHMCLAPPTGTRSSSTTPLISALTAGSTAI